MAEGKGQAAYDGILVGQNIRKLRMKKGLSIYELSDKVGKSESHMKQVELGSRRISLDLLLALMKVLETDANEILVCECNKKEKNMLSIDLQLKSLPEKERSYLITIFQSMIEKYPVVT